MKGPLAQLVVCSCCLAARPTLAEQPATRSRSPDLPSFQAARAGVAARPLTEKLTNTISVKDFDAQGDTQPMTPRQFRPQSTRSPRPAAAPSSFLLGST